MTTFLFLVGLTATTLLFITMAAEEVVRTKRSLFDTTGHENILDLEDGQRQSRGEATLRRSIPSPSSSHPSLDLAHGASDWDDAA